MNTILLFGMPGGAELFFIVLIVIMLFGSKKIPELARGLGRGIREIKNATGEIQREITEGTREVNSLKDKVNVEKQVKDLIEGDPKEKKIEKESPKPSNVAAKTPELDAEKQQQTSNNEASVSQTVQRKSPYAAQEPKSNSEEVE